MYFFMGLMSDRIHVKMHWRVNDIQMEVIFLIVMFSKIIGIWYIPFLHEYIFVYEIQYACYDLVVGLFLILYFEWYNF